MWSSSVPIGARFSAWPLQPLEDEVGCASGEWTNECHTDGIRCANSAIDVATACARCDQVGLRSCQNELSHYDACKRSRYSGSIEIPHLAVGNRRHNAR